MARPRPNPAPETTAVGAPVSPIAHLHLAHAALNTAIDHLEARGKSIPAVAGHCARMRSGLAAFTNALSDFEAGLQATDPSRRPRDGKGQTLRERLETPDASA